MTHVLGPAWTAKPDTPEDIGRQPLAVETVIGSHAAALIPGVITTTPHARYVALHARLAIEARRRGWTGEHDRDRFRDLVRRAEVVLGAVSVAHAVDEPDPHRARAGDFGAHGINTIGKELRETNAVDVDRLADAYSQVPGGYLQTYAGIEFLVGLTDGGRVPAPGPAADEGLLSALDEVVAVAGREQPLSRRQLRELRHLCLCGIGDAPDGECVRRAYFVDRDSDQAAGRTHRLSAALLVGALNGREVGISLDMAMDGWCCFHPKLRDLLGSDELHDHARTWRGALLRNWSVWAWRLIWAELVSPLAWQPGTREDAVEQFAGRLPDTTVQQALVGDLPAMVEAGTGTLLPAEHDLYHHPRNADGWTGLDLLRLLAVGAARLDHLDPDSRAAFVGTLPDDLGPEYVARWLHQNADRPLAGAAAELAGHLFQRAESVSRQKMQWTRAGLRLPTRLRRIGDRWRLEGEEGSGPVSLRLPTFTSFLRQLGILAVSGDTWTAGRHVQVIR
ncbi:hypothetical protein RM555_25335 [Micromonospora sp. DSM 115977]|uniref:Uncharacterized protein n=1 Tax=Micromonospora reichwaldensis TaxID=3075516 RepID=A0ABU2X399_9ACTN|nr:hypothetical protein [Micromonospora sp. DSM 115977]MDT0532329.1 hypothetical protein [Micromonospora sp. DSM 115977]